MKTATRKQRFVWAVVCICVLAAIGGVVQLVFRLVDERKRSETVWAVVSMREELSHMSVTSEGLRIPSSYSSSGESLECEYDKLGRLIHVKRYTDNRTNRSESYDLEYYYVDGTPITCMTHTDTWTSSSLVVVRKEQHEYYPTGVIRSSAPYWDEEHQLFAYREFYDEEQKLVRTESYDDFGNVDFEARFSYDAFGHLIGSEYRDVSANGAWEPGDYKSDVDAEGRVLRMYKFNDSRGGWRLVSEYEYYIDGTILERAYYDRYDEDENGVGHFTTTLDRTTLYDHVGRTVQVEYPSGSKTVYDYSPTEQQGMIVREINGDKVFTTEYDRNGKEISTQTSVNGVVTDEFYIQRDSDGRPIKSWRPIKPGETHYSYDRKGNLTEVTNAGEDGGTFVWTLYDYDRLGNLSSVTYANGDVVLYEYVPITITKEQAAENAKFYMDLPTEMETIPRYRDSE